MTHTVTCPVCAKEFQAKRKDAKFCSPACRYTKHNTTKKRIDLPYDLRFGILVRDGFRCVYCGKTAEQKHLRVDHVVSIKDGGALTDQRNLVTACFECNAGKGERSVDPKDIPGFAGR